MKLRKHALLWVALLGPTAELGAQDVLAPGARLRLTAPAIAKQRMVGRLIAEEADSLRLEVGTGVITLPRESVTKMRSATLAAGRRTGRASAYWWVRSPAQPLATPWVRIRRMPLRFARWVGVPLSDRCG